MTSKIVDLGFVGDIARCPNCGARVDGQFSRYVAGSPGLNEYRSDCPKCGAMLRFTGDSWFAGYPDFEWVSPNGKWAIMGVYDGPFMYYDDAVAHIELATPSGDDVVPITILRDGTIVWGYDERYRRSEYPAGVAAECERRLKMKTVPDRDSKGRSVSKSTRSVHTKEEAEVGKRGIIRERPEPLRTWGPRDPSRWEPSDDDPIYAIFRGPDGTIFRTNVYRYADISTVIEPMNDPRNGVRILGTATPNDSMTFEQYALDFIRRGLGDRYTIVPRDHPLTDKYGTGSHSRRTRSGAKSKTKGKSSGSGKANRAVSRSVRPSAGVEGLAADLVTWLDDFDHYEFADSYDSWEDAYRDVLSGLGDASYVGGVISYLEEADDIDYDDGLEARRRDILRRLRALATPSASRKPRGKARGRP